MHERLGLEREPGLANALVGTTTSWRSYVRSAMDLMLGTVGVDRVMNTPGLDNLHILTSGSESENPNEFLNLNKINSLMSEMQEDYDIVLIGLRRSASTNRTFTYRALRGGELVEAYLPRRPQVRVV